MRIWLKAIVKHASKKVQRGYGRIAQRMATYKRVPNEVVVFVLLFVFCEEGESVGEVAGR